MVLYLTQHCKLGCELSSVMCVALKDVLSVLFNNIYLIIMTLTLLLCQSKSSGGDSPLLIEDT